MQKTIEKLMLKYPSIHDNTPLYQIMDIIENGVSVKQLDNLYILNYMDVAYNAPEGRKSIYTKKVRENKLIQHFRGMVIDTEGNILCLPFRRFFNYGESEADKIDWASAEVIQKIDGSMVNLWYSKFHKKWMISTRSMIPPDEPFKSNFWKLFVVSGEHDLVEKYCYTFELVSFDNRIKNHYSEENLWLLGVRDMSSSSLTSFGSKFVAYTADKVLEVKSPEIFKMDNLADVIIESNSKEFGEVDFEGFVVKDGNGNMIKVKNKNYFEMARIANLKPEDMIERIKKGEVLPEEFSYMFPEAMVAYDKLKDAYIQLISEANDEYLELLDLLDKKNHYSSHELRKWYARIVSKKPTAFILFKLYDKRPTNEGLSEEIANIIESATPKYIFSKLSRY